MSNRFLGIIIFFSVIVLGLAYWIYIYAPKVADEKRLEEENTNITLIPVEDLDSDTNISGTTIIDDVDENNNLPETEMQTGENYKTIKVDDLDFNFVKDNNNTILYMGNKIVGSFSSVSEDQTDVKKIYGVNNEYLIIIGKNIYTYNRLTDSLNEYELNVPINYVKKSDSVLILNTSKGSYVYNNTLGDLEYVDILEDFVYANNGYVGVIKSSDSRRKTNYSIDDNNNNVIFYYNPTTKGKTVLYSTAMNITKIYNSGTEIYFEENNDKIYKLQNF